MSEALNVNTSGELYLNMVQYLKTKLQRPFTTSKISMLLANAVQFLAKVDSLSGSEKKTLALYAIRQAVNDSSYVLDDEKAGLLLLIDTFGDAMVNILVDFGKDVYLFIQSKICASLCTKSSKNAKITERSVDNTEEYNALKRMIERKLQKPISGTKIVILLADAVRAVEVYKRLSGSEKKALVIRAIRETIIEADITDEDRTLLLAFVDTLADETINYLVKFGRDTYMFVKKRCWCC
jgi:hypothetical protein